MSLVNKVRILENRLKVLISLKKKIEHIHSLYKNLYPIAIVDQNKMYIFNPKNNKYELAKIINKLEWLPEKVLAAFPLKENNYQITCVVYSGALKDLEGLVLILHEYVHCYQYNTCEQKLKQTLQIAREAMKKKQYDWEINHPFPYNNPEFEKTYENFLKALKEQNTIKVKELRKSLKKILSLKDYEYMIWQEWKEGYARYIENKIRRTVGLKENHTGAQKPYTRTVFYEGGALLIQHLVKQDPSLHHNIEKLFYKIKETQL